MKKAIFIALLIYPTIILAQTPKVEVSADYMHGGVSGLKHFIMKEFKFRMPPVLDDVGRIYVDFIVTEEGKIDSIKVWNNINKYMSEEIVRVLELTNKQWIPGSSITRFVFFPALTYYGDGADLEMLYSNSKDKAMRYYNKGKVKNAIKAINKCINYKPVNSEDFEFRAKCKLDLGDSSGYEEDMNKAHRLKSFIKEHGELIIEAPGF